ncbi:MAG TPA: ATP-binding protein [Pseudonocardia sp.]|jgi:anti-sigma regulatory factor (Ser/Thr protein kinase)
MGTQQVLTADAGAPAAVRRALSAWLCELECPLEQRDDLVLAVHEAVANVVDHAYRDAPAPGSVVIGSEFSQDRDGSRWVTVTVTDRGVWRPVPEDNGYRGRGLQMIGALTDWRWIEPGTDGTRVTMVSRVCAPARRVDGFARLPREPRHRCSGRPRTAGGELARL